MSAVERLDLELLASIASQTRRLGSEFLRRIDSINGTDR